jgi:hypothetical protein
MLKYCRENGIDISEGMIDEGLVKGMMNSLSMEERKAIENSSSPKEKKKASMSSAIDLENLQETNPALYRNMMNYCKENGIDISQGIVDEKLVKGLMNSLSREEKQ